MRKIEFDKGKVGRNAHTVSKVWKLGFHLFQTSTDIVFRLCYLRTKKGTHYIQVSKQIRQVLDCAG